MEIQVWDRNTLSPSRCNAGVDFIRRRFLEVWGIYRSDVTRSRVMERRNLIMLDNTRIVGWLGLERDGELTNACIEHGYHGALRLSALIVEAYRIAGRRHVYANVPLVNGRFAGIFLQNGMRLPRVPFLTRLKYRDDDMVLVRLSREPVINGSMACASSSVRKDLVEMQELSHAYRGLQIPTAHIPQ